MIGIIAVSLATSWHVQRVDVPGNPQRIVVIDGTSVVAIESSADRTDDDGDPLPEKRGTHATKTVTLSSIRLDGEHVETHVFPAVEGALAYMPRLDRNGEALVSIAHAGPHVLVIATSDGAGAQSLWAVTADAPPRLLTHIAADVQVLDVIENDGGVLVVERPRETAKTAADGDDDDKKRPPVKARVSYVDVDSGEASDLGVTIDASTGIRCSAKAALCAYLDGKALMTVERGKDPRRLLKNSCSDDCALSLSPGARFIAVGRLVVDRAHPERSTYVGATSDWHTGAAPKRDADPFCIVSPSAWLDDEHLEVSVDQRPSEQCFRDPPECRAKSGDVVVDIAHATRRPIVDDDPWTPEPCGIDHRTGSLEAECMGSVEMWGVGKGRAPVSLALDEDTALVFGDRRRVYSWHAPNATYDDRGTPVALDAASIVHFRDGGVDVTPAVVRGFRRVEATLDNDWLVLEGGGRRAYERDADAVQPSSENPAPGTPLRFALVRITNAPDDAR